MGVNSLPKTVTRQRRDCDLNPGPAAPESSTLTTRLPSHPERRYTSRGSVSALPCKTGKNGNYIISLECCSTDDHVTAAHLQWMWMTCRWRLWSS